MAAMHQMQPVQMAPATRGTREDPVAEMIATSAAPGTSVAGEDSGTNSQRAERSLAFADNAGKFSDIVPTGETSSTAVDNIDMLHGVTGGATSFEGAHALDVGGSALGSGAGYGA